MDESRLPVPALSQWMSRWVAYKWHVLTVAALGSLLTTLDSSIALIALPELTRAMDVDASLVAWVSVSRLLVGVGLLLTMGWVGDTRGRNRIFILGVALFTAANGMAAATQDIYQLIATRALGGIGAAMILSSEYAILTATFSAKERGMAMGMAGIAVGLGLGLGPFIGGALIDTLGWRSAFWIQAPVGVIVLVLTLMVLRLERGVGKVQMDLAGAVTIFISLASLLLAVNQGGRVGFFHPITLGAVVAAVAGFALLPWVERRARRPVMDLGLFRHIGYTASLLTLLFAYLGLNSVSVVAPFLMIYGLGYSTTQAGLFAIAINGMRLLVSPLAGRLSDRVGTHRLAALGLLLATAGMILVSRVNIGPAAPALLVAAFLLVGLGASIFEPPTNSAVMGSVPRERLGTASASIATFRQMGLASSGVLGIAVLAYVSARHAGVAAAHATPAQLPPASIMAGASQAMLVAAGMIALAFLINLGRWRRPGQRPPMA